LFRLEEESNEGEDGNDGGEGDGASRAGKSPGRGGGGAEAVALVDGVGAGADSAGASRAGAVVFGVKDARSGVALGDLGVDVVVGGGRVGAEALSDGSEVVTDRLAGSEGTVRAATVDAVGVGIDGDGDNTEESSNEGNDGGTHCVFSFLFKREKRGLDEKLK